MTSKNKKRPYNGPQEAGRMAFLSGLPRSANPWPSGVSHHGYGQRWDSGWIKAKLASEQNKRSI